MSQQNIGSKDRLLSKNCEMSMSRRFSVSLLMTAMIFGSMTEVSYAASDSKAIVTATENFYAYLFTEETFSNVGIVKDDRDAIVTFEENPYITLDAFLHRDRSGNWSVTLPGKGPFTADLLEAGGVPASEASLLVGFPYCGGGGSRCPGGGEGENACARHHFKTIVSFVAPARYYTYMDRHTHERKTVHIRRAEGYGCEK